jgi:hypothetical protein
MTQPSTDYQEEDRCVKCSTLIQGGGTWGYCDDCWDDDLIETDYQDAVELVEYVIDKHCERLLLEANQTNSKGAVCTALKQTNAIKYALNKVRNG